MYLFQSYKGTIFIQNQALDFFFWGGAELRRGRTAISHSAALGLNLNAQNYDKTKVMLRNGTSLQKSDIIVFIQKNTNTLCWPLECEFVYLHV